MNILLDVKMFDKNVFDLYTQNDNGFAGKIGSFELDNLPDVALSFAKKYNSDTIFLVGGNHVYNEGLKEKIAREEKARNGYNQLLINII